MDASASSDTTPERWLALSVDRISPMESEFLVEPLLGLGARSVQEVEGRLITYVPPPVDPEAFVKRAQDVLREATGLDHVTLYLGLAGAPGLVCLVEAGAGTKNHHGPFGCNPQLVRRRSSRGGGVGHDRPRYGVRDDRT